MSSRVGGSEAKTATETVQLAADKKIPAVINRSIDPRAPSTMVVATTDDRRTVLRAPKNQNDVSRTYHLRAARVCRHRFILTVIIHLFNRQAQRMHFWSLLVVAFVRLCNSKCSTRTRHNITASINQRQRHGGA
jgi:aspartokinase